MNKLEAIKVFYSAAGLLCEPLWHSLAGLDDNAKSSCEELRLRVDRPMELYCGSRRIIPDPCRPVTSEDLQETLHRCTGGSVHTHLAQLCRGFATARGGHRFGVCGEAVYTDGSIAALRGISSLNIRVARQMPGLAKPLTGRLRGRSLLVLSEPGVGKTTLLRDLARELSLEHRVAVLDTRYELAGVTEGRPSFRIGSCDVLSGALPTDGLEMLTRTMSPQYIVLDEITGRQELAALEQASFTGVRFLASCHAGSLEQLEQRPLYRSIMDKGLFSMLCRIIRVEDRRCYELWEEDADELAGSRTGAAVRIGGRLFVQTGAFRSQPLSD